MDNIIIEELGKLIAIVFITLPPIWFIVKKAGFNPWLSCLVLIPPAGTGILIIALFLGFKEWPNKNGEQ